ncbi:hypothetical protein O181_010133 [Austropuccinia psidii MF-1]|uniref:Uncharacterized protein n=1 Tax=Austropuccinia psidii MF-1 TaxID=1389203 RepID=A0A9Q3BSD8_9BASI|nr:hypothetical protein [Austropuccinia psidii MF-1]
MAFLGHLAPYSLYGPWAVIHSPQSVGLLGPNPVRRKVARGSKSAPKTQVGPPEPAFAPNPNQPKMAKTTSEPKLTKDHLWATIQPMASGNHQRPPVQGKILPSSMHPVLKDPGVVHIWYNIPLCTIFAQQSNRDLFRTQLRDLNSSPQSLTNFEGGCFSYSVWQFLAATRRPFEDPNHLALQGLGCHFSSGLL